MGTLCREWTPWLDFSPLFPAFLPPATLCIHIPYLAFEMLDFQILDVLHRGLSEKQICLQITKFQVHILNNYVKILKIGDILYKVMYNHHVSCQT